MQSYPKYRSNRKTFVTLAGWSYCNSGSGAVCGPLVSGVERSTTTVTDFVNSGASPPTWKQDIKVGRDATSSLEGVRYRVERRDTYETNYVYKPNPCIRGAGFGHLDLVFPSPSFTDSTNADMAARSDLLKAFIDLQRSFAGASALVEFRDTVGMLKSPVKALFSKSERLAVQAALVARRARLNTRHAEEALRRASEELGSLWLGWAWGVKPLLSDISDINLAISERFGSSEAPGIKTTRIDGSGVDEQFVSAGSLQLVPLYAGNYGVYQLQGRQTRSLSVRYAAGIRSYPAAPGGVATTFGFDPFDFLPAVWEGVPWSHIIDYFTGVGEQLDAMRYALASPTWGFRTVRNVVTRTDGSLIVKPQTNYTVRALGGHCTTSATFVSRSRLGQLPVPIFHFKLPSFGQWVNVGALATQGRRAAREWAALRERWRENATYIDWGG